MAATYPKYGEVPAVQTRKVDKMPVGLHGHGVMHPITSKLLLEIGAMEVGEVLYIPIEEEIKEDVIREVAKKRYENAFFSAKKHLKPKEYRRVSQGFNLYIERTA